MVAGERGVARVGCGEERGCGAGVAGAEVEEVVFCCVYLGCEGGLFREEGGDRGA